MAKRKEKEEEDEVCVILSKLNWMEVRQESFLNGVRGIILSI